MASSIGDRLAPKLDHRYPDVVDADRPGSETHERPDRREERAATLAAAWAQVLGPGPSIELADAELLTGLRSLLTRADATIAATAHQIECVLPSLTMTLVSNCETT